ncbi:MAG TPA: porin family protein [Candidatus Polarisedimenticolia bacterium]|nr:porin family protein [Candidatus Polarisedimenticolia bacterium]
MRNRILLAPIAALMLWCASPALAQNRSEAWELNPYMVFTDFDRDTEIDEDLGVGFRFGYNFTPLHEMEFSFDGVSTEDSVVGQIDVDVFKFQSNYTFNFNFQRHQPVIPYFTTGLGFIRFDVSAPGIPSDDEVDMLFNFGGGVRFFIGPVFNIRLDFRFIFFEGDNQVLRDIDYQNNEFGFGVGWVVGGKTPSPKRHH